MDPKFQNGNNVLETINNNNEAFVSFSKHILTLSSRFSHFLLYAVGASRLQNLAKILVFSTGAYIEYYILNTL